MFQFLSQYVYKHVLHSLMWTVWERPFAHDKTWSPPSPSFCVHSQTAILHVLGQQKGNVGN